MISNKDKNTKTKKRIKIIIIIIIILLLLTSCGSSFYGRIGNMFKSISSYIFDDDTKTDNDIIINKNLLFDSLTGEANLDDVIYKIGFNYTLINPSSVTCQTSDASIATCVAYSDYVDVHMYKEGKATIFIETKTNGKTYKATHNLTINESTKNITFSKYNGNIYLDESDALNFAYYLNNIKGKITVSANNDNVIVSEKNGKVTIKAKKVGSSKITITLVDNTGKRYTKSFNVNIMNTRPTTTKKVKDTTTSTTKSKNNYLKNITLSNGSLSPDFNKNTLDYIVDLPNAVEKITIDIAKDNNNSKVTYLVNNKPVNNLNNINLKTGENIIKINVTAENKQVKTYTIKINRALNNDATLKNLTIDNFNLDQPFNSNILNYNCNVLFNTSSIKVNAIATNNKSTLTYYVNGTPVDNLNNVNLNVGNNIIKIKVTAENNTNAEYIIKVHRPSRTISFDESGYQFNIEYNPFNITYTVYEDGIEINNFNKSDIAINFTNYTGTYVLDKNVITLTPTLNDVNKNIIVKLTYNNEVTQTNLRFVTMNYFLNVYSNTYDIDFINNNGNKNIIFNTNILGDIINQSNITNGIKLTSNIGGVVNSNSEISITSSNPNIAYVSYDNDNSAGYYTFKVTALNPGDVTITISSSVYNQSLTTKVITIHIIDKYQVIIDSNDGFFDSFTTKYEFIMKKNDILDLSEYVPYKVDDTGNCLYYELINYNTKNDNSGESFSKNDLITITDNITLYAIYSATSKYIELVDSNIKYLTDVDLFLNQEYYDKHNIKKMIYPGTNGYHVMQITNNTANKLIIKKINLEEDTVCISEGCINMGYIIKYDKDAFTPTKYYYGSSNNYKILNSDSTTTISTGIASGYKHTRNSIDFGTDTIEVGIGETIEISLLWKWVDLNNLDTKIGSIINTISPLNNKGDNYQLTVSIEYDVESIHCTL